MAMAIRFVGLGCALLLAVAPAMGAERSGKLDRSPPPAETDEDLTDPKSFAAVLQDLGYRAQMARTDNGSPKIETRAARTAFSLIFGGCTRMRNCGHVLVIASWDLGSKADPLSAVNEWNNKQTYGRAWYDEDNDSIGLDVTWDLVGTVSRQTLDDQLNWWSDTLEAYQKFLSEKFGDDSITDRSDGTSRDI